MLRVAVAVLIIFCCCQVLAERSHGSVGSVDEGGEFDHGEFDQELLAGGMEERRKLMDLSPEEVAKEMRKLVGRIDGNGDGKLNKEEIIAWLHHVEDNSYKTEAEQLFLKEDTDNDGYISFEEYWLDNEGEELPNKDDLDSTQKSVDARFSGADTNGDGKLDKKEFAPFIHPFRHEHMIGHLVNDQLVLYDKNHDGKISMEEFSDSLNPEGLPEDELPEWVATERADFKERLDKDHDDLLGPEEIKMWMAPNDREFFEEEAKHLLTNADKDKDGFLSFEEVEAEFDMFAESPVTDYGHVVHEEL